MQRPSYNCNAVQSSGIGTQQLCPTQLTSAELYQWGMSLTNKHLAVFYKSVI